ncbi:Bug family tripartite tricarboxylate transporter substrate binding protein [Ramlibacter alkalitolerans]|uniref:Tripartite tricarboxylate transporter substrate binding protein n=1 Tax=Ramlibacter alkalitolerans TaxID=2039631 RepID=A0ABS1JU65_9BURK|nr:tripartite tricarboxylate transporter substrate binding protein [Ramlibacter alkalitolerans]MBL0427110.1 tripartite tricarboxylate transporter substrate binding protein [Ramlibacter alkalitolerans]
MHPVSRRTFALGAVALAAAPGAFAQNFPERTVKFVVPYPPGGFNDTLARVSADKLTKMWNQPVVVENKPGANTTLGNSIVAKSPPDGYTILITPLPFSALPGLYGANLPYDALKDFTPLVWAGSTQNALVVRNDLPVKDVKELLELARKTPGKLNYGSTGSGSSNHLSMELFMRMTGVKLAHIPYKGSAPAVTALLGGEIDALFDNVPNVVQHIKAGKMKVLGVSGLQRAPLLPEVPTVAESGVPGYEVNVWFGMQLPAGTPRPVVDRLNHDIVQLLKEPDTVQRFRAQGVEVVASTPEEFRALVNKEVVKWTQLIKDANIRIE